MNTSFTFKFGQTCSNSIDMATSPSKCRFGVTDSSNHQDNSQTSPVRSINCSSANMNLNYNSDSNSDCQTDAIDLSVKGNFEAFSEKRFYCPAEGCVFSKGMGKSFKKKMLVDQHFLNCHSERKYRCSTCGKSYAIEWQLRYHTKTCGIDWVCMSCHKVYKERLSLITHCKRHNHLLPVNAKIKKYAKDGSGVIASSASTVNTSPSFDHNNNNNANANANANSSSSLLLEQQQQQQLQQQQHQHSLFQQQLHLQHQQQQQQQHFHHQQQQQQLQQQQFANNVFKLNYSLNQPSLDSHSFNESAVQLLHLAHLANSAFANAVDNPEDERSASPKNNNCNSMVNLNLAMAASKPFRLFRRSNNNFD